MPGPDFQPPDRTAGRTHDAAQGASWLQRLRQALLGRPLSPWAVLLVALLLTLWGWRFMSDQVRESRRLRFEQESERLEQAILDRLRHYETALYGARGLFPPGGMVDHATWRRYVDSLDLANRYPGALGLGLSLKLTPAQWAAWEARLRAEGLPDIRFRPEGERPERHAIVYLEPLDRRNMRAIGFDMYSEPVRRAAMERARDTGTLTVSGRVTLVQELDDEVQPGFLMYLPVYREGDPVALPARRDRLVGFVYSPFRMGEFMRGILGAQAPPVDLAIYDGEAPAPEHLLFDASRDRGAANGGAQGRSFRSTHHLELAGRRWTLAFAASPADFIGVGERGPWWGLAAGLSISLLLFGMTWMYAHGRTRALALATAMTEELRESREQHAAVTDTASDAIVSADESGRVIHFNRAAERLLGYEAGEVLDRPLTLFIPPAQRAAHEAGFARYRATEEARLIGRTVEMTALTKAGEEVPVEISLAAWRTGRGRFFTAILRDVRERKASEAALQRKNEELVRASEAKDRFLASMSHELRTPLNAVIGYTGMLLMRLPGPLTPDQEKQLKTVQDSARHLLALINDLLDVAKVDAGKVELKLEPTDCRTLVHDVAATLKPLADAKGLRLDVHAPDAAVIAKSDRRVLSQILLNLGGNAVKFTDQGVVRLGLRDERASELPHIVFEVEDTGVGIRAEDQARLFHAFSQLDRDRLGPREGTGLGLYVSRRLADLLGATLALQSEYGRGSVFRLLLREPDDAGPR